MEYEVVWGGDPEDILITTSGDASVADLHAWVQEAIADPRFRENMKVLIDHTQTRWWALSNEEIRLRGELITGQGHKTGSQRLAFVVGSPVDFGIGRMLQAQIAGSTQLVSEVFESIEAARDWLRLPGAGAAKS
jgi:hypothetical protein